MSYKIAYVAATPKEIAPFLAYLKVEATAHSFQTFQLHGLTLDIIYSGIGVLQTSYHLMDYISHRHPDVWIQAGIGGAFDHGLEVGSVYQIKNEMLSGFGAEEQDGRILNPFELGWKSPNAFPYTNGLLECPYLANTNLPLATGMTTFYAHGNLAQIEKLRLEPSGQIENMEGAPFFYISLVRKIPFLSIRSISNQVEPRDKSKWKTELAIQNLNEAIIAMLEGAHFNGDQLFSRMDT